MGRSKRSREEHLAGGRGMKLNHAGAKNGGGFWGRRAWAKEVTRSIRRATERAYLHEVLRGLIRD